MVTSFQRFSVRHCCEARIRIVNKPFEAEIRIPLAPLRFFPPVNYAKVESLGPSIRLMNTNENNSTG